MLLESTIRKAGLFLSSARCFLRETGMLFLLLIILFSQRATAKTFYCPYEELPIVTLTDLEDNVIATSYYLDTVRFRIEITYDTSFWPEEITSLQLFQDINSNGLADPEEFISPIDIEIEEDEAFIDFVPLISGVELSYVVGVRFCPTYTSVVSGFTIVGDTVTEEEICFCLNDAALGVTGHFYDRFTINTFVGDTLTVISTTGAFSDDAGTISIETGDFYVADTLGSYEIYIVHESGEGYELTLETRRGSSIVLSNQCTYPQPVINVFDAYCMNHPSFEIEVTSEGFTGDFSFTLDGDSLSVFDPVVIGEGLYTIDYSYTADTSIYNSVAGCTSYGTNEVEILPATEMAMVCNSYINVGLGDHGYYDLNPSAMLRGTYDPGCFPSFEVMIMGKVGRRITCDDIGVPLLAMVTNPGTGEGCFTNISVADILPPVISAQDTLVVGCELEFNSPELVQGIETSDNCSQEITLGYDDFDFNYYFCNTADPTLVRQFVRRYNAVDESGNIAYFNQVIQFRQPDLNDLELQDTFYLDCNISDDLLTPAYLGYPSINGVEINMSNCSYHVTYEDSFFPGNCTGRDQLRRTWSIMNPCTMGIYTMVQNVVFQDTTKPVINCLSDITVYQDAGSCTYEFTVPGVDAEDECSDSLLGFTLYRDSIVYTSSIDLPIGEHRFTQYSNDLCGNLDSCAYTVYVLDNVAPVITNITVEDVYLNSYGIGVLKDSMINIVVEDCSDVVDILFSRTDSIDFGTSIAFNCTDVGLPVELIVQVTDIYGNIGVDNFFVEVFDTIAPVLICTAKRDTITCDEIPLHLGELFNGYVAGDFCELDTTYSSYTANLNSCNIGEIIQEVYVADLNGNVSTCLETVVVEMNGFLLESNILWPEVEFISETCDEEINPSNSGEPLIGGFFSCTSVEVDYVDSETENIEGCRVIERNWTVLDQCTFDATSGTLGLYQFTQTIIVRKLEYDLVVPADVTLEVTDGCSIEHTLDNPVALNCFGDIIITNDFDDSENTSITAEFPVGTTTITYTAIDVCGNEKIETTVITVLDNIDPIITNCPSDTTVMCTADLTDLELFGIIEYEDNCSATLVYTVENTTGTCGTGTITRNWVVTDPSGNAISCQQIITVEGPEPLTDTSISWPDDLSIADCSDDFSVEVLGEPSIDSDQCRRYSITFTDSISEDDGCTFIQREWTLIDSCDLYLPGENIFVHVQNIDISTLDSLELTIPTDYTFYLSEDECTVSTSIELDVEFGCTSSSEIAWIITYPNEGTLTGEGVDLTTTFPVGISTIVYSITQECYSDTSFQIDVEVLDTIAPVLTIVPEELMVSCTNTTYDPFVGISATDACGIDTLLTSFYPVDIDECGRGSYEIEVIAYDFNGNSTIGTRSIVLHGDTTGLDIDDFSVMTDTIYMACGSVEDMPEVWAYEGNDQCLNIDFEYTDEVGDPTANYCAVINRQWIATSACYPGDTIRTSQVIVYTNEDTAPNLDNLQDTLVYFVGSGCTVEVLFDEALVGDCFIRSWTNDSPYAYSADDLPSGEYPAGYYIIEIEAENYCGTTTVKSILLSVIDTIAPEMTCLFSEIIIQVPNSGDIFLHVNDLVQLSEECSQNFLTYDLENLNDTVRYYGCPDLGVYDLIVWGVDNSGNEVSCAVEVTIADDALECGSLIGSISGSISTINESFINDVELYISNEVEEIVENVESGTYTTALSEKKDYKVTPAKIDNNNQGTTILDVIMLSKYLIKQHQFDSPYQVLAADIDGDKQINSRDLNLLRNIVLGKERNNNSFKKWKFVPRVDNIEEYTATEVLNLNNYIIVDDLKGDLSELDFVGVKAGDLNNTAFGSRSQIVWMVQKNEERPNTVMIFPEFENEWSGYQLDVRMPENTKVQEVYVESDHGQVALDWYANEVGELKILSMNSSDQSFEGAIIYIVFDDNANLGHSLLPIFGSESVLVQHDLSVYGIGFRESIIDGTIKAAVYPNPSKDVVVMEIETDRFEDNNQLNIYDSSGRLVMSKNLDLIKGTNKLVIESAVFPNPGIYMYKLTGNYSTLNGQIIRID